MTLHKLYYRFSTKPGATNNHGLAPIRCRLTYNKNRKDFSTGISDYAIQTNESTAYNLDQSDQEETTNM